MDTLILIGIIMTITGIFVLVVGTKRNTQNTWLWALFPISHGMHEFIEYFFDTYQLSFMWERLELSMAFLSSTVLLAAIIEFNNFIPSPIGKYSGASVYGVILFFIFAFPESALEESQVIIFTIGHLSAEPLRFLFGTIMPLIGVGFLIANSIAIFAQDSQNQTKNNQKSKISTIFMAVALTIFSFFEGFDSQNQLFVTFRAISLSFFIILPIFVVLTSDAGLKNVIILDDSGVLLYQYDFGLKRSNLSNEVILSAGFLAAISGYSKEVLHGGNSFTLRSKLLYFSLIKSESKIFTIQSRSYNKNIEKQFLSLPQQISKELGNLPKQKIEDNEALNQKIAIHFQNFT